MGNWGEIGGEFGGGCGVDEGRIVEKGSENLWRNCGGKYKF